MEHAYVKNISEYLERNNVPVAPVVKANGFVFVSGAPPIDPNTGELVTGDIVRQTEVVMNYLRHTLEAAGSSLARVVKVTIYAANAGHFRAINDVYSKYFVPPFPARTFVTVGSWPMGFDIEIECVALAGPEG